MTGEFYLSMIDNYQINHKVYGDTGQRSKRILDTFQARPAATGVMLDGEKGSGKTLLTKHVSIEARERGIPTIVINSPFAGEEFNKFIQSIEQEVVILFDEFEKVYPREEQEQLLTLLDGLYPSKKLYVITSNDPYKINAHMQNRPGRIFYRFDYSGLEEAFIREYCEDNLDDKSHIDTICRLAVAFGKFNFDILKAMVEEMNRYQESPHDVMKVLNAKPDTQQAQMYDHTLTVKGVRIADEDLDERQWSGSPLAGPFSVSYIKRGEKKEDYRYKNVKFEVTDLKSVDPSGRFHFENADGDSVTLAKPQVKVYDYNAF